MGEGDLEDLLGVLVRDHKEGTLRDDDRWDTAGPCPDLMVYIKRCSLINLVKIATIRKHNPRTLNLVSALLVGRPARNVNRIVGDNLTKLMLYSSEFDVTPEEETRAVTRFRDNPDSQTFRPCTFYCGKGSCRLDLECDYLHLRRL